MIIIDVDINTMRMLRIGTTSRFFYIENEETLDFYTVFNGMLFRYVYKPSGDIRRDRIFLTVNFGGSYRVKSITNVNEEPWRELALKMADDLGAIRKKIEGDKK